MIIEKQISGLSKLSAYIKDFLEKNPDIFNEDDDLFYGVLRKSQNENSWFTLENQKFALKQWADLLDDRNIEKWISAYEGAVDWKASDGTSLKGKVVMKSGLTVDADDPQEPVSDDVYFIVTDKCTECIGFHEEPQCAAVCPVDCCIPDDDHVESEESLLEKKAFLHGE